MLVCYFDEQLATVDYLQIGDMKLLHLTKPTRSEAVIKVKEE